MLIVKKIVPHWPIFELSEPFFPEIIKTPNRLFAKKYSDSIFPGIRVAYSANQGNFSEKSLNIISGFVIDINY